MTDSQAATAKVRRIKQWSPIWVVPLAAILVGCWMLYNNFQQQGALLTLIAADAEGIIANKTQIKSRSVDVGQVVSVELSEDLKQVIIKARMKPAISAILNQDSQFWVVKPQVGRAGVTGLDTLLSGAYIELQPGESTVEKREYELLATPPAAPADAPGIRVMLSGTDSSGLAVGDPVLYRGYEVGTVEYSEFNLSHKRTDYQLFIREPYDSLVSENVRFWLSSGFAFDLTAEGLQVDVASVTTLLSGGVSFDLMQGWPAGKVVTNGAEFQLFPNKQSVQEGMYNEYVEYLLFFDESVRGLKSGAPVEYRGIRVGTVVSVPFFFSFEKPFEVSLQQGIPVLIRIETGRLYDNLSINQLKEELNKAVAKGMHATLKPGNLLTGALFIELALNKELLDAESQINLLAEQKRLSTIVGYPMLPTARSGLSNIEQKVLMALDKINNLPIEQLLLQGDKTLQSTDALMQSAAVLVLQVESLLASPQLQQLPQELQQSMQQLQQMLSGISPGSPAYDRLDANLQTLDQVLRDVQPILQLLNQQSNALFFNVETVADPEPKRAKQ
ncbi:intermembrane transport protein PqiB [Rheinheimera sp. MMS21-TC3]|uniref:intermembrane transport protein PqiB n=1 Tax=Rheinheimera sp. MMS21-TC3 TaxID=3072790 RepID=UPI0028C3F167|nr:intermembrane transport protein PqiB [Rheinheimera sp. MMS21-TC3]WNO61935.1 intermembrane transport protein PqiB [Rheinheimera sp. MMS21-TC3]